MFLFGTDFFNRSQTTAYKYFIFRSKETILTIITLFRIVLAKYSRKKYSVASGALVRFFFVNKASHSVISEPFLAQNKTA